MRRFIPIIAALFTLLPFQAYAYNNWGVEVEFLSLFDIFFDILSFSVAIVAFGISFQVLNKLGSGLRKAWLYLMISIFIFILLQLLSLLSLLKIFDLTSTFSIFKLLMSIGIIIAVLQAKSFFNKIILSKASKNNELKEDE